jgi:membrane protein insertase Oxa1/YidC/SpoIIIJ
LGQSSQDPGNLDRFELLIDWGRFHFITKPLFLAMDWIYRKVGNVASRREAPLSTRAITRVLMSAE